MSKNEDIAKLFNPLNKELTDAFILYERSRNCLESQINTDRYALHTVIFFLYRKCDNKPITEITALQTLQLFNELAEADKTWTAYANVQSALTRFFRFLRRVYPEYKDIPNYAARIKAPPKNKGIRVYSADLTSDEVNAMLECCITHGDFKYAALIALLSASLMSFTTISHFLVRHFDPECVDETGTFFQTRSAIIQDNGRAAKRIHGLVLVKPVMEYLKAYGLYRESVGIKSKLLFPRSPTNDKPISETMMVRRINEIARSSGIDRALTRTSFYSVLCENMIESGFDEKLARKFFQFDTDRLSDLFSRIYRREEITHMIQTNKQ